MAQSPTAAIAVAAIFGGIALLFFGYKLYKKCWNLKHKENLLPPVREPPTAYYGQTVISPPPGSSPYSTMGTSNSRASLMTSPALGPAWYHRDSQASVTPSERPSPTTTGLDSSLPMTPAEAYDPNSRAFSPMSSSSSTMTLKKSYATSSTLLKSSSASQHSLLSISMGRRESYLPHSPHNRDSIQIIPPQPLGFGLGGLATATDQKTLAFSKTSGIGGAGEDFGSGLVWAGADQQDHSAKQSVRSNLGEDDRKRYLQQGPSHTHRSNSPANSSSPSISSAADQASSAASSRPGPNTSVPATVDALYQTQSPLQRVGYRSATSGFSQGEVPHSPRPSEVASLGTENSESPILAAFRPSSKSPAQSSAKSVLRPSPPTDTP